MQYLIPSLRLWLVTMTLCVIGYSALVLGFAQTVVPYRANGSIIEAGNSAVGSELVAQEFTSPGYFWPRPSAAGYDGMGAMGSNLSPTSDALTERAAETVASYGATAGEPLPVDLVAASGGGLDPHVSLAGALYQVPRIARARGVPASEVERLVYAGVIVPNRVLSPDPIVNVLKLNLALDGLEE